MGLRPRAPLPEAPLGPRPVPRQPPPVGGLPPRRAASPGRSRVPGRPLLPTPRAHTSPSRHLRRGCPSRGPPRILTRGLARARLVPGAGVLPGSSLRQTFPGFAGRGAQGRQRRAREFLWVQDVQDGEGDLVGGRSRLGPAVLPGQHARQPRSGSPSSVAVPRCPAGGRVGAVEGAGRRGGRAAGGLRADWHLLGPGPPPPAGRATRSPGPPAPPRAATLGQGASVRASARRAPAPHASAPPRRRPEGGRAGRFHPRAPTDTHRRLAPSPQSTRLCAGGCGGGQHCCLQGTLSSPPAPLASQ